MKHRTAVAMILEARRQGEAAAQQVYDIATKQMLDAFPTQMVEALRSENDRLQAEVARLTAENKSLHQAMATVKEADAEALELGWMVRAMPKNSTLENANRTGQANGWQVAHGGIWFNICPTPTEALKAAGIGQEEEPCQK